MNVSGNFLETADLPSGNLLQKAIENGPFIVDFPMKNGWIFPWQNVSLPEGRGFGHF